MEVRIKIRDLGSNKLKNLWSDSVWRVVRKMGTNETYEMK